MDSIPHDKLQEMIIVCKESEEGRRYSAWESHAELYRFILTLSDSENVLHEVCPGNKSQKPRFDVDIESLPDGENDIVAFSERVKDSLIACSIEELQSCGVEISANSFSIFTSHGSKKRSYHIIINGFMHSNCTEARAFYDKVIERVEKTVPVKKYNYIDSGIYSPNHCLRMVWSHKLGSSRFKVFEHSFSYRGETVTHTLPNGNKHVIALSILSLSLVTWTHNCTMLPRFASEASHSNSDKEDLAPSIVRDALKLMREKLKDPPLEFYGVKGGIVRLIKSRLYNCPICNRCHRSQNPYLFTVGSEVYFHCGRAEKRARIHLGSIDVPNPNLAWNISKIAAMRGVDPSTISCTLASPEPLQETIPDNAKQDDTILKEALLKEARGRVKMKVERELEVVESGNSYIVGVRVGETGGGSLAFRRLLTFSREEALKLVKGDNDPHPDNTHTDNHVVNHTSDPTPSPIQDVSTVVSPLPPTPQQWEAVRSCNIAKSINESSPGIHTDVHTDVHTDAFIFEESLTCSELLAMRACGKPDEFRKVRNRSIKTVAQPSHLSHLSQQTAHVERLPNDGKSSVPFILPSMRVNCSKR